MSDGMTEALGSHNPVKHPQHYMLFEGMEAIEAIRELLTEEEYRGYLKGNILKYRFRAGKKDRVEQDIAKAMQYDRFLGEVT